MWSILGHEGSLTNVAWPEADASKAVENTVEVVFQVNGKTVVKVIAVPGKRVNIVVK